VRTLGSEVAAEEARGTSSQINTGRITFGDISLFIRDEQEKEGSS
jgi:hypothetical protein